MLDHPATSPETTGLAAQEPTWIALPDPFRVPLSIEAFSAFARTRPAGERWELFDGVPVMQASANQIHNSIVSNLIWYFRDLERVANRPWSAIPGVGVRLGGQPASMPVPDVLVRPTPLESQHWCDDPLVLIEVLSNSTADRDLRWKRRNYPRFATLDTYAVVAQDRVEVTLFSRANGFAAQDLTSPEACLPLAGLGVDVPLSVIYWRTGLMREATGGEG